MSDQRLAPFDLEFLPLKVFRHMVCDAFGVSERVYYRHFHDLAKPFFVRPRPGMRRKITRTDARYFIAEIKQAAIEGREPFKTPETA